MKRRLLRFAARLSLLLCLACIVMWVRSYWVADQWIWSDGALRPGLAIPEKPIEPELPPLPTPYSPFPEPAAVRKADGPRPVSPPYVPLRGHRYVLTLLDGRVYLMHDTSYRFAAQFRYNRATRHSPTAGHDFLGHQSAFGFEWAAPTGLPPGTSNMLAPPFPLYRIVGIPYWFITACAAVLPLAQWHHARRQRRRLLRGQCTCCGYDLRATPDRCPECGTPTPSKGVG